MKNAVFFFFLLFCNLCNAQDFVEVKQYRTVNDNNKVYSDVLSHSFESPLGNQYGRSTNTHETVHSINSEIKNSHYKSYKYRINGFYYGRGQGVVVKEPRLTMRDVVKNIPENLRSYRFKTYFVSQLTSWNDTPTYIMDEWIAYIFGGESAVQDYLNSKANDGSDAVSGCLDFSIYTICLCITIQEKDPEYWDENKLFKSIIKNYLDRAEKTFFNGKEVFKSDKQEVLFKSLINDPSSKPVRDFLKREFDSVFIR